jgi:histone-lysine N-methyltransferase SETD3
MNAHIDNAEGPVAAHEDDMRRMLAWMAEQGATFPGMDVLCMEQGSREAYACAPLRKGALVLHLPRSLLMTTEVAKASRLGKRLATYNPDASYYGYLAALLLDTRHHGGFWAPYVAVLPSAFPEHPLFFSEKELEWLKGSYALRVVRRHKSWLEREYQHLSACLPDGEHYSPEEHAWALVNVLTRTYGVRIDGEKSHAMIPLADMPNHAFRPNALWEPESSRGFFHIAARDIESGAPLTIRYWKECNTLTFAIYGFCLETNPYNVAEIHLPSLPPDHPNFEAAREMGTVREGMRVFKVPADVDDKRTQTLFAYLRLSIPAEPSVAEMEREKYGILLDSPLHQSERAAADVLASACRRRLQQFDTCIEEDQEILKTSALPLKLRFAAQVRLGEKVILKYYLDMAEAPLPDASIA